MRQHVCSRRAVRWIPGGAVTRPPNNRLQRAALRTAAERECWASRRSLRALEQSLARLAAQVRDISRDNSATPAGKPRRKLKLSPARLTALRLHGRYLGYIRQLKPRQRARIRALRAKKGIRAAIERARKLAAR